MVIKQEFYYSPGKSNRNLHIYLPDGKSGRFPVMYFFDGHNLFFDSDATYGKSWGLKEFLDHWDKPMIVVGLECSHTGSERLEEYLPYPVREADFGKLTAKGDETLEWLLTRVKPYIDDRFPTIPFRECTGIAGSSMGGLMALYAATTFNHVFQRAACLSPSLWVAPGKMLEMIARAHIRRDTCIYLDYGEKEMFNHAANAEALFSTSHLLMTKRVNLAFRIVPGGTHCEASWAKQVPIFMECLGV